MTPELKDAKYAGGYKIRLCFNDGTTGTIDFEKELWGEVFEPMRELDLFRQFSIHPEFRTLCWPNGADFAPEYLYQAAAQQAAEADA
ncbi:MAG: DUF2442 domain-containing protein [Gammaproteobacteria bacterium]